MFVTRRKISSKNFKYFVCKHYAFDGIKIPLLSYLKDMSILISQKLGSPIAMDIYGTHNQALIQGKKITSAVIHQGATVPIYIAPLNSDKWVLIFFINTQLSNHYLRFVFRCTKTVSVGQYFSGTISYPKDEQGKKVVRK